MLQALRVSALSPAAPAPVTVRTASVDTQTSVHQSNMLSICERSAAALCHAHTAHEDTVYMSCVLQAVGH
jgi:acyl-CoA thioesterase FadM